MLALGLYSKPKPKLLLWIEGGMLEWGEVCFFCTLGFPKWVEPLNTYRHFFKHYVSVFSSHLVVGLRWLSGLHMEREVWTSRELEVAYALTAARGLTGHFDLPCCVLVQVAHGLLGPLLSYLWCGNPDPRGVLPAPGGVPGPR